MVPSKLYSHHDHLHPHCFSCCPIRCWPKSFGEGDTDPALVGKGMAVMSKYLSYFPCREHPRRSNLQLLYFPSLHVLCVGPVDWFGSWGNWNWKFLLELAGPICGSQVAWKGRRYFSQATGCWDKEKNLCENCTKHTFFRFSKHWHCKSGTG